VAGVLQGKRTTRHGIDDTFFHEITNHAEHRVVRHIVNAWCDAEPWWADFIKDQPCDACLRGNAPAMGPTGHLPVDDGLIYGVPILWLMNNPLYGQLDAGAIWNRTFNEFVTRRGPPLPTGTSSTHAADIELAEP